MHVGQVIRKVIRRVSTPTPETQGGDVGHRKEFSPVPHDDRSGVGMMRLFDFDLCSWKIWVEVLKHNVGLKLHWVDAGENTVSA